jgi:RimJ/RimL family protein N-acetyltransferase
MVHKSVFIRSEKTILRPFEMEDVPLLLKWINDPEVRPYIATVAPQSTETEKRWIERVAEEQIQMKNMGFMIETHEGVPIGTMGLHSINLKDRHATTGAMIIPEFRNKGYGVATKMHLLKYAFWDLNLNRVNSRVIDYNSRSLKYSEKCGYVEEGRLRRYIFKNGEYRDEVLLGVLREEWEAAFQKYQEEVRSKIVE